MVKPFFGLILPSRQHLSKTYVFEKGETFGGIAIDLELLLMNDFAVCQNPQAGTDVVRHKISFGECRPNE
jgi:hypothetical protein